MITEIDLETKKYKLITYKEFVSMLNDNFKYIHIVNKENFLYIEVQFEYRVYQTGIGASITESKEVIYQYDFFKVKNI